MSNGDYPEEVENSSGNTEEVSDMVIQYFDTVDYEPETDLEFISGITKYWAEEEEYLEGDVPITSETEDDEHTLRRRGSKYLEDVLVRIHKLEKLSAYSAVDSYGGTIDTLIEILDKHKEQVVEQLKSSKQMKQLKISL